MHRLWIALLAACLAAPVAGADEAASAEELPWWAHRDGGSEEAEVPWWAGGPREEAKLAPEGSAEPLAQPAPQAPPAPDATAPGADVPDEAAEAAPEQEREANQCHRYRQQIPRFKQQLELAEKLENEMARGAIDGHLQRLKERQKTYCPEDIPPNPAVRVMKQVASLAKFAAKGALKAFTYGAF